MAREIITIQAAAALGHLTGRAFDRQPGETVFAFALFVQFCQLGESRSYKALAAKLKPEAKNYIRHIRRTGQLNDWKRRALAFDQAQGQLHRLAEERAAQELKEEWKNRARKLKEQQYDVATKMLDRAREMLKFPLAKKTVNEGTGVTEIHPTKWTASDIPRMVETANKLLCLATGQATENVAVNATVRAEAEAELNLDSLSIGELEQFKLLLAKTEAKPVNVDELKSANAA